MVADDYRCSEERGRFSAYLEPVAENGLVADGKNEPTCESWNFVCEFSCTWENEPENSERKYGCAGDARDETADRGPEKELDAVHDDLQRW